jgi:hypothetical protein
VSDRDDKGFDLQFTRVAALGSDVVAVRVGLAAYPNE